MHGLMQDRQLTIPWIFHRVEQLYGHKVVVTATPRGDVATTYREWAARVRKLAAVLDALGISDGGRVGTYAANSQSHLEVYIAAPCTNRVVHTINIRLSTDDVRYIIEHADDEVVFIDRARLADLWPTVATLPGVKHWIVLDDGTDAEVPDHPRVLDYEQLLAAASTMTGRFVVDDERRAAGLCYTSGTTGRPKGVAYSHRSIVLHTLMTLGADYVGVRERDQVMPIVPMFHVNAWGLPHAALMAGAGLILPGASLAPENLLSMIERHRATVTGGVPTVWESMVPHFDDFDLSSLRIIVGGGSATPPSLFDSIRRGTGIPITHAWGMTETSPIAVVGGLRSDHDDLEPAAQREVEAQQGQPVPLVELRLVDTAGIEQPWDGESSGEIQVAGPWAASAYFNDGSNDNAFTVDGWLRTGDLATINETGYVRIVDRLKDVIKSGGEWISSVALENAIVAHPDVAEAAVIAKPDPRWMERPVACVVVDRDSDLSADDILDHLRPLVAKWWLPDEIRFVDQLPRTGTGKIAKALLRDELQPSPTDAT